MDRERNRRSNVFGWKKQEFKGLIFVIERNVKCKMSLVEFLKETSGQRTEVGYWRNRSSKDLGLILKETGG